MKKILFYHLFLLLIFSTTDSPAQQNPCTHKFSWLKGTWKMNADGSVIVEQWTDAGSSLKCKSYEVKGADSAHIENASISCIGGKHVFTYYPEQTQTGK